MKFRDLAEALVNVEIGDDELQVGFGNPHPLPPDMFAHEIIDKLGEPFERVLMDDFLNMVYICDDCAVEVTGQVVTQRNGDKLMRDLRFFSYKDLAQYERAKEPEYNWSHPDDLRD